MKLKNLLTALFFVGSFISVLATHLRAGEIVVRRISGSTYEICIVAYVNTDPGETSVQFGLGTLNFGDNTTHSTLTTPSTPLPGVQFVGVVRYCVTHTYSGPGEYTISYFEQFRNADILNMANSVATTFYLETKIKIDPLFGTNNSVIMLVPPIDKACTGAAWFHNPGAYDEDGDSLSYELIPPRQILNNIPPAITVGNYSTPNAQIHYTGLNYENAQEDGSGRPTFEIDPITGTLTWDAPGKAGEYNIAFLVIEWRKVRNIWVRIGSVVRDMQILVEDDCKNERPKLEIPEDICVVAGEIISEEIFGTDPDNDQVKIEVFSQTLELGVSPATYAPVGIFQNSSPSPAQITFNWQTHCAHVQEQSYTVVFKITDKPTSGGVPLVSFATWRIRVIGPPPVWNSVTTVGRNAQLNWNPYACAQYADSIQIWRKIDSLSYEPDECETGIREGLGYEKIKTLRVNQTSYLDTNNNQGLPPGAVVCYRLVALFPAPFGNTDGGSESKVSDEACLGPIIADIPIMTNVTIDTTSQTKGVVTVRWVPPFDLDPGAFPPPYRYDVFRADGLNGEVNLTKIASLQLDTFLIDKSLNTQDKIFNYRVLAYDNTNTAIDTSFPASTVRLSAKSLLKKIELKWIAEVPWSLTYNQHPWHRIYRGSEGDKEGDFVLIDSVNTSLSNLQYTDDGRWNGIELVENTTYCYRIETLGNYGFDDTSKIPEPLINFSQIVCSQPSDTEPPCQPLVQIELTNCDDYVATYGCDHFDFSNVLKWPRPTDDECRKDISHYRIYYSTKKNGLDQDYQLLVDLENRPTDTSYVDRSLPSFARCYKLVAVDRSGNESEWSEEVCNDNCPAYHLPNVFTPGDGDQCNDFFSTFSERNIINGILQCGGETATSDDVLRVRELCPRFVLKVEFTVVNRWGNSVFTYTSGGENSIFIDWDGRDSNGQLLNTGVYYYNARVTFATLKPEESVKNIKGWVHLIRPE